MKVAFLVPGGVDRTGEYRVIPCLLWLIERLARTHTVHVFALRQEPGPATYTLRGATVHVVGRRPHRLRMIGAVVAEHFRGRIDIVHAVWALPSGMVAGAVNGILGLPVLLHLTGGDLAELPEIDYGGRRSWAGRRGVSFAIGRAKLVTTPSGPMRRAAERLGVAAERLPFGVALDRWPVRPPTRRRDSAPFQVIHVASLNRVKDQATLLRAIRILADRGVSLRVDIVGEDTMDGEIQSLCRTLDLTRVVEFHGFLPHRDLRPLVERSHLLVMTSRHEADPLVVLEAAVAGVPTVSTNVGHAADWAPEAAVVVPVGDPVRLADAVADLIASEDKRLKLAFAAQRRAIAEDADQTAGRVMALYDAIAEVRESES